MIHISPVFILALMGAAYVAWSVGANDVANAIGTSVGSSMISYRKAIVIASIFELLGATFAGKSVSSTVGIGLLDASILPHTEEIMVGMLAVLIATGTWLQIATWLEIPVSTSHTIVASIIGFTLFKFNAQALNWDKIIYIVIWWFLSPILSGIISFMAFHFCNKYILTSTRSPLGRSKLIAFIISFLAPLPILYTILSNYIDPIKSMLLACLIALPITIIFWIFKVAGIHTEMVLPPLPYSIKKKPYDLKKINFSFDIFSEKIQKKILSTEEPNLLPFLKQ